MVFLRFDKEIKFFASLWKHSIKLFLYELPSSENNLAEYTEDDNGKSISLQGWQAVGILSF